MKHSLVLSLLLVSATALLTCVNAAPAKDKWEEFPMSEIGNGKPKASTADKKKEAGNDMVDIPVDDNSWDKPVPKTKKVIDKTPASDKSSSKAAPGEKSVEDFLKDLNIPNSDVNSGHGKWKLEKQTQDGADSEVFEKEGQATESKSKPKAPKPPVVPKKKLIKKLLPKPAGYVKEIEPEVNYAKKNYLVSKNLIVSMQKLSKVVKKMVAGLVTLSKAVKKLSRTPKKIIREIEKPKDNDKTPKSPTKKPDFPFDEPKNQHPDVKLPAIPDDDDFSIPEEKVSKTKPKKVVKKPKSKRHPDDFIDNLDLDDEKFKLH